MFATCHLNHIHLSYFMVKSPNYKAPYAVTSTFLDVITVNILSWNTFNLCSTLGVIYQGIHPYNTSSKF